MLISFFIHDGLSIFGFCHYVTYYQQFFYNWKKVAYQDMENEVSIYDQYLTGQVYGIITEEFDTDTGTWEEQDSCWGYFSDKWGDDLIEEIASEYGITEELHDKAEAA